jgi:hypothetical protein
VTKIFDLYFHCLPQNHQNQNCFCQTPCNHSVVEEEKRLRPGPASVASRSNPAEQDH